MKFLQKFTILLVTVIYFSSFYVSKTDASVLDQNIVQESNEVAEEYGYTPVSVDELPNDKMLNFNTVEEFEAFLKELENDYVAEQPDTIAILSRTSSSTKNYSYSEINLTGKITSYAKVTRNTNGIVSNVKIWSEQTGIILGITWTEKTTWYDLNTSKKGGNAYVRGTKLYGANVVGQAVGYSKSVTYTVPF